MFANHVHCVDHPDTFHGAEIHGGAVVDFFAGENRAFDNVINVSPIADLRSVTPHFKWSLLYEGASNHRDDGMIFHAARAVYREVPARSGAKSVLLVICLQRE